MISGFMCLCHGFMSACMRENTYKSYWTFEEGKEERGNILGMKWRNCMMGVRAISTKMIQLWPVQCSVSPPMSQISWPRNPGWQRLSCLFSIFYPRFHWGGLGVPVNSPVLRRPQFRPEPLPTVWFANWNKLAIDHVGDWVFWEVLFLILSI